MPSILILFALLLEFVVFEEEAEVAVDDDELVPAALLLEPPDFSFLSLIII